MAALHSSVSLRNCTGYGALPRLLRFRAPFGQPLAGCLPSVGSSQLPLDREPLAVPIPHGSGGRVNERPPTIELWLGEPDAGFLRGKFQLPAPDRPRRERGWMRRDGNGFCVYQALVAHLAGGW